MKIKILQFLFLISALISCTPEIDEFEPDKGSADFSKFVAVGGSYTAGYADAALYRSGQSNSFVNILATQFQLVGGSTFKQPLMLDDVGFGLSGKKRVLVMAADCKGVVSLTPKETTEAVNPLNYNSVAAQGPYNNMGVPFCKSFHATVQGYGNANPYFGRFMTTPLASVIGDAAAQNPSFFTLWLGVEDILTYAIKGGEYSGDSVTPFQYFQPAMNGIAGLLTENGAKGAIANIPDITALPFCTTVPATGLLLDATTNAQLTAGYAPYNAAAVALNIDSILFHVGYNYWIIEDKDPKYAAVGYKRQMKPGEILLLSVPQDSLKCKNWGSLKPIPSTFVLDLAEIQKINNSVAAYNQEIGSIAASMGLALVDMHSQMNKFKSGMYFDGIKISTAFVTGGLFSLDGLHLNPRGNAVVANCFLESINNKYGAKIPLVNIGDYPGVLFP